MDEFFDASPLVPRFVVLPLKAGSLVEGFRTASSGGRKRKAAFGILSASRRCAVMIDALAVIPGRSFRSALLTSTTAVYVTTFWLVVGA